MAEENEWTGQLERANGGKKGCACREKSIYNKHGKEERTRGKGFINSKYSFNYRNMYNIILLKCSNIYFVYNVIIKVKE